MPASTNGTPMRISRILLILFLLVLVAAGVYVWLLPVDVAYRYGAKYLGPVALSGLSGTLWEGHADGISVLGRDLGELDWRAQKGPLLGGRFVADLRIKGADIDAAGTLTRDSDGSLLTHDVRFSVPAQLLAPALDLGDVKLFGTISGVVSQARFATTMLSDATGNARWSNAGVAAQTEAHFADLLADFSSQPDGGVAGNVHDDGTGNLAVSGTFTIGFGTFEAQALLSARNADAQVAESLRYIGEPQPDGASKLIVRSRPLKAL